MTDTAFKYGFSPCRRLRVFTREGKPCRRVLLAFKQGGVQAVEEETLCIAGREGEEYSPEYVALTGAFYKKM